MIDERTFGNPQAQHYVDLQRYPIDQIHSAYYKQMLAGIREELLSVGCAVVPEFVRADKIAELISEADRVAPHAHRSFNRTNAYFTKDDASLPESHPVRRFYDRSNSFVPADNFGKQSPLRAIYEWPPVMTFVQDCLQERDFYRYADPLADVIINVVEDGNGFPWHFDTNNYTVTLAIQNGESGGLFEYVPNLRSSRAENYAGVQAILDGDHSPVRELELNPGDLQIFKGRYSLHRGQSGAGGEKTLRRNIFLRGQTRHGRQSRALQTALRPRPAGPLRCREGRQPQRHVARLTPGPIRPAARPDSAEKPCKSARVSKWSGKGRVRVSTPQGPGR